MPSVLISKRRRLTERFSSRLRLMELDLITAAGVIKQFVQVQDELNRKGAGGKATQTEVLEIIARKMDEARVVDLP